MGQLLQESALNYPIEHHWSHVVSTFIYLEHNFCILYSVCWTQSKTGSDKDLGMRLGKLEVQGSGYMVWCLLTAGGGVCINTADCRWPNKDAVSVLEDDVITS